MKKKRKLGRKLLSFLLTLAMVFGLMPGMSLTAYAAPTETLLTTITATGKEQASYSTSNVATVSFSYTAGGSSAYNASWGWWGYGFIATVTPADGYTITKCVFYDDQDRTATDSEAPFVVETTEEDKTPKVNGTPILAYTSKGIKKIEVYGYVTPAATHSVTITLGSNMTKTAGSGDAEQIGLTEAMTDVVYTADDGYYFPTNYSVAEVSGIKVTRDSYTQITVSGTPTADAAIALTAPTAKTTPDAPTAAATDCTTADNNDGTLTGVTTAMEYKKSDAADWTAGTGSDITGLVPGTYYVRVKATDTSLASDNQQLTIKAFGQKETATVTKAPTAKTGLTYTGSAQELVTAGTATGGTLYYAVTTENTAPTDESLYTTSIPTKTEAGTYYVWYKVKADSNHIDTEPECREVKIMAKADDGENTEKKFEENLGNGTVTAETRIGSGSPVGKIENIDMDFAKAVLSEDEQKDIQGGASCLIYMETKGIDDDTDHSDIDEKMKENVSGASFGMLFDISLYKQIGNSAAGKIKQRFKDNPVKITMAVPEELQSENRMFYVGCEHEDDDGTAETEYIETTTNDDGTISFEITGCSTYALYYTDPVKESSDSSSASTAAGYVTRQRVDAAKLMSLPSGVKIKYTTSDKKLAKVSRKGVIKIQKQAGTVTITAKKKNTGATIDSCTLVIENPVIKQKKLVVTGVTAGNSDSWKTRSANEFLGNTSISPKWYSSKPSVAAVDQETGEVTIKGRGKAKIYAVFGADAVDSKFGTRKIYKYKIVSKK
ncbi:hypothetical protein QYZ88_013585 [Lachnospiraceae bacterium C1.1]|nr:hypothetical protein [Lachnospiraceae bacterium C1.1]